MMPDPHLAAWSLSDPELIADTPRACVYRVADAAGTPRVLKAFKPPGLKCELPVGSRALEHWAGRGAVRLIARNAGAQLLEHLDGPMLTTLPDDQATEAIIEVAQALHAAPGPAPQGMPDLRAHLRALFDSPEFPAERALAARLLETTELRDVRLLHADIHHENILGSARGWAAIDPHGAVGDRHYDLANAFNNPDAATALTPGRAAHMAERFAAALGLDKLRLLQFARVHAAISICWHIQDSEDPSFAPATLEMFRSLTNH